VFRQRFDEPPIKNLLGLRERPLCVERPGVRFAASAREFFCEEREEDKNDKADNNRQEIGEMHAVSCLFSVFRRSSVGGGGVQPSKLVVASIRDAFGRVSSVHASRRAFAVGIARRSWY
jgi:hypothetical protein